MPKVNDRPFSLTEAVYDYHKKNNLEYQEEEYTYTSKDGSTLTVNIESVEKEREFRNTSYRKAWCNPDEKTYTANVVTRRFQVREWAHEEKEFRTIKQAKRYVDAECQKNEV